MLKKGDKYKILIGYDIAYENIFDRNIRLRDKVIINKQEFEVIGILEKNSETNNNIFVEENTLIELLAMKEEEINLILIQSKPGVNLEKLEEDIIKEFRKFRNQEKGKENFLIPETKVYILFFEEKALGVSLPPKVKLKVTEAEDAVAGDTVNAPKKPVTLETGLVIQAPLFIRTGDTLLIDTESGSYVSRAN